LPAAALPHRPRAGTQTGEPAPLGCTCLDAWLLPPPSLKLESNLTGDRPSFLSRPPAGADAIDQDSSCVPSAPVAALTRFEAQNRHRICVRSRKTRADPSAPRCRRTWTIAGTRVRASTRWYPRNLRRRLQQILLQRA